MNIKELRFIHDLLTEETEARKAIMNDAAGDMCKAEELSEPFTLRIQREVYERARDTYYAASRVLQSFEDEEWK